MLDFSHFTDIPVIDGHIHFMRSEHIDDMLKIMETVPYTRINLLSLPNKKWINDNPPLIRFKAHYPDRVFLSGGLDYHQVLPDRDNAAALLANQVKTLRTIGFDGIKMSEKPTYRKWFGFTLDAPEYDYMWTTLEDLEMPLLLHIADPEEFWDEPLIPSWAQGQGLVYDDSYPTKEALYEEVDCVLEKHPRLTVIFPHLYFLAADLERAARFLDAHPNIFFDLTPGLEMYNHFAKKVEETREFFIRYQDRLIYGTDIMDLEFSNSDGISSSLGKAWLVRSALETDGAFTPPENLSHWLYTDWGIDGFRGMNLPEAVLEKIYRTNFERVYGTTPLPLNKTAALSELERLGREFETLETKERGLPNQAYQVAQELDGKS